MSAWLVFRYCSDEFGDSKEIALVLSLVAILIPFLCDLVLLGCFERFSFPVRLLGVNSFEEMFSSELWVAVFSS